VEDFFHVIDVSLADAYKATKALDESVSEAIADPVPEAIADEIPSHQS